MTRTRRWIAIAGLTTFLAVSVSAQPVHASTERGFNDEYIFATTKAVNDMQDVNPGLKLTLFPVTVVLDTAFLPFAVIAGFVT